MRQAQLVHPPPHPRSEAHSEQRLELHVGLGSVPSLPLTRRPGGKGPLSFPRSLHLENKEVQTG